MEPCDVIPVDQAIERILSRVRRVGVETVALGDGRGRVLAADAIAPRAIARSPPERSSARARSVYWPRSVSRA
jgi:molybdopterin biosynthesis enzyme